MLGRGGMGIVWRARDEYLHRDVAVKEITLPDGLGEADRAGLLERFVREARAAARLDHPAIISVYDVITEDGLPWIVMRLVRGRSLDQLVRDDGALPPVRAAAIGLQVLDALGAAHAERILHRDVTPRNVLVGDDGRIVLTDFGIASIQGATALTGTGALIGSPGYMAPERLRGHAAGPESDLWSLGATLYFAAEGRRAYEANEAPVLIGMVLGGEHGPVRHAGPLEPVLRGLLVKDPAARMTAGDARLRLRTIAEGRPPAPPDRTTADPVPVMGLPLTAQMTDPRPYGPVPGRPPNPAPAPKSRSAAKAAVILSACGLVLLPAVTAVAVNVIWNPLHLIGEGGFARVPACAAVRPATLDTLVGQARHAESGHCEWWSLGDGHRDFQVISATRYTRSWWTSADERAHAGMTGIRGGGSTIDQPNIGDEAASDDSGDGAIVWFRTGNVIVKVLYTSELDKPGTTFRATQAAREIVRALAATR